MSLVRLGWAFFVRDLRQALSYHVRLLLAGGGLLFVIVAFFFVDRMLAEQAIPVLLPYGGRYFPFVIVGIALSSYMGTAQYSIAAQLRDAQLTGTFEVLLTSRAPPTQLALAAMVFPLVAATARVLIYIAGAALLFGMDLGRANWPATVLSLALAVLAFLPFGILSAAFVVLFKVGDPIGNGLSLLGFLVGGVYYPVSVLPEPAWYLSRCLPITWALEAVRQGLLAGASVAELRTPLCVLALFAGVGLPLALGAFSLAIRAARRTGALADY